MRITSQPAKRDGWPKELFDRPLAAEDVVADSDGVTITLIVRDIYSKGSNQRYTITMNFDDLATILGDEQLLQAAE
jgi:hypothetical protein